MIPSIHMSGHNYSVECDFNSLDKRLERAKYILTECVISSSRAFMPLRTGNLQQRTRSNASHTRVTFPGPYARFLYYGKVMVDPLTGSPWARRGAKKVVTNRNLRFSQPNATAHWFEVAKKRDLNKWLDEVRKVLNGK